MWRPWECTSVYSRLCGNCNYGISCFSKPLACNWVVTVSQTLLQGRADGASLHTWGISLWACAKHMIPTSFLTPKAWHDLQRTHLIQDRTVYLTGRFLFPPVRNEHTKISIYSLDNENNQFCPRDSIFDQLALFFVLFFKGRTASVNVECLILCLLMILFNIIGFTNLTVPFKTCWE